MKVIKYTAAIAATIIVLLNVLLMATNLSCYPTAAEVIEIKNDTVTVETATGNLYCFTGSEDWLIGDLCAMTMFDNFTESITDDIILDIRYCGTK